MIALALLVALAAPAVQEVQELHASAVCTPSEVEIGEPIEVALEIDHPSGVKVRVQPDELALDPSWIQVGEPRVLTTSDASGAHTRARWVVASLEPGARRLALPLARYEEAGVLRTATAEPARVTVRAALGEGEDAPRPAEGFRPPPEDAGPRVPRLWVLGAFAAFVAGAFALFFVARSRRGRAPVAPPVGPLDRFDRWRAAELAEPADVRALHYELSRALREVADRRIEWKLPPAGLTDEEWLARAAESPGLSREMHEALAEWLAVCDRVKYAQELPTRWAAQETLAKARALAERLLASGSEPPKEAGT